MQIQVHRSFAGTFRALRHRNFKLWFFGQFISLIGVWMEAMALQVLIYDLTGSAAALGIVNFIGLIPLIPLSLIGGSITDRYPRQRIIFVTQISMMSISFLLAVLTLTGAVRIWHVFLMSFLTGTVNAVDMPARQAFTVDLVNGKEDLSNAIGLNSAMFNGARAIGPALAGLAVAATGSGMAFLLNGLTFLAVLFSLAMMRDLPPCVQPANVKIRMGTHILEGLKFIRSRRDMSYLVSLVAVSAFLSMPYNTLMPVFATKVLSESALPVVSFICSPGPIGLSCQSPEALPLGMLLTTVGIGALIGALIVASLSENAHRGRMLTIGNLGFPILLLAFALSRSFLLSLALLLFIGISFVWQNALANTLIQVISPDQLRGRVMAMYSMVFQSTMRLGGLQAGYVADWFSAPFSVGIGALLSLLYGLFVAIKVPEIRRLT